MISLAERRVIATIVLPGRPRWAVFDRSADAVYVNIQDPAVILAIGAGTLTESSRIEVGAARTSKLEQAAARPRDFPNLTT